MRQDYTAPPAPKCLIQNVFLPNELSYQDAWQQPFLLTIAYAQGLKYWVEKLNLPENPDFHPLVKSVIELRERVKEHIVFTDWDVFQDLEGVNLEAMGHWPQSSLSGLGRVEPPWDNQPGEQNAHLIEAATQTTCPVMSDIKLTGCITPLDRTEEENQYVLVITISIRQLDFGTADDDLGESVTASPRRDVYWNPCMAALFGANEKGL